MAIDSIERSYFDLISNFIDYKIKDKFFIFQDNLIIKKILINLVKLKKKICIGFYSYLYI